MVQRAFVGATSATDLWAAIAELREPGSTPEPTLGALDDPPAELAAAPRVRAAGAVAGARPFSAGGLTSMTVPSARWILR